MDFWENVILGEWDNWICIKSRALGVKVDRRSQSQPAGLEQGVRERSEVLVNIYLWTKLPRKNIPQWGKDMFYIVSDKT